MIIISLLFLIYAYKCKLKDLSVVTIVGITYFVTSSMGENPSLVEYSKTLNSLSEIILIGMLIFFARGGSESEERA